MIKLVLRTKAVFSYVACIARLALRMSLKTRKPVLMRVSAFTSKQTAQIRANTLALQGLITLQVEKPLRTQSLGILTNRTQFKLKRIYHARASDT